jgi:hypothetical protein
MRKAVAASAFAQGAWLWVVGAGIFALGGGRLLSVPAISGRSLVVPVALMALGGVIFAAGPRITPAAVADSVVGRSSRALAVVVEGPGSVASRPRREPVPVVERDARAVVPLVTGVLLALVAGVITGVSDRSGVIGVIGLVVAICVLALVLWRPEVMLLVIAAFPWVDWAARRTLGGFGAAWDEALVLACLALLIWCALVRRDWEFWTIPITLPLLLALVMAGASIVIQHVPADAGLFGLRSVFQPVAFYFIGFLFPKDKRWVQWVVALFVLAGVALALHGLYQYFAGVPVPAQWIDTAESGLSTRAFSVIYNPNGLGAVLLLGILVSMALAFSPGLTSPQRGAMGIACAVQLAGEAVTFSRGGWIGLAAGVLALFILAYRRYLAALFGLAVVGWFTLPQVFIDRLTFGFSGAYITKSLTFGRLWVWLYALRKIASHPLLGVGLGTFGGVAAVKYGYSTLYVDNFYLQMAAEGGLVLLILFLWMLLSAARALVKARERTADPYLRGLATGAFGAFVAVAAANLTASVWETLVVGVGFWFIAGLATSACFQRSGAVSAEEKP